MNREIQLNNNNLSVTVYIQEVHQILKYLIADMFITIYSYFNVLGI